MNNECDHIIGKIMVSLITKSRYNSKGWLNKLDNYFKFCPDCGTKLEVNDGRI